MRLDELPALAGVEHRQVSAGGSSLHLAEAGSGPPVLMLHGWPQHWYMWRGVIPALSGEYRLICPDLPGFGWSQPAPAGYTKEALAEQLLALLDVLGLQRVLLAGHDWGAWISVLIALRAPERVRSLLVMDVPPPFQRLDLKGAMGLWRLWYQVLLAAPVLGERAIRRGFHERMLRAGVGADFKWPADELAAFVRPLRQPAQARASVAMYRTFLLRELGPLGAGRYADKRLTMPTVWLAGDQDPVVPPEALEAARRSGPVNAERVPRTGHFLVDERPELVSERASALFASAPS